MLGVIGFSKSRTVVNHFATMTNSEIIDSCKQYTMWSWSAQKAVNPLVMTRAKGIFRRHNGMFLITMLHRHTTTPLELLLHL